MVRLSVVSFIAGSFVLSSAGSVLIGFMVLLLSFWDDWSITYMCDNYCREESGLSENCADIYHKTPRDKAFLDRKWFNCYSRAAEFYTFLSEINFCQISSVNYTKKRTALPL
jgi:hypothetical protein